MNGDWAYLEGLDFSEKIDLVATKHKTTFGVLVFAAPEILNNKSYTQSADIYSIGMVMYEIATGKCPFHDRSTEPDDYLAISICYGKRPEIKDSIPKVYRKIMEACWDPDPLKRPDIFKLQTIFTRWRQNPPFNITQQFEHADDFDIMNNDIGNTNLFNKFCNSVHYNKLIIIYSNI